MKKEILFRGEFDNGNGMMCWIEGDLIHYSDDEVYIMDQNYRLWDIQHDGVRINDLNTIGQYIGIKDKNGVKIFEGDYIKDVNTPNHGLYLVAEMNKEQQLYYIDTRDGWASKAVINFSNLDLESIEIVGSVHDKPTLEIKIKTE